MNVQISLPYLDDSQLKRAYWVLKSLTYLYEYLAKGPEELLSVLHISRNVNLNWSHLFLRHYFMNVNLKGTLLVIMCESQTVDVNYLCMAIQHLNLQPKPPVTNDINIFEV